MKSDRKICGGDHAAIAHRQPLLRKISPFLRCLQGLPDPVAKRSVQWTPLAASLAAVCMTLDRGCSLAVRCQDALSCLQVDFNRRHRVGKTYNGLMRALLRQAPAVLPRLKADLREQARQKLAGIPRVQGWWLLAVDGSKEELPRTVSLEEQFGIADNGKCPQSLFSVIVEVFTGLPWDWRIDKGRGNEREHLLQMADGLPGQSLLLADGGYVGYAVWSRLQKLGRDFLIRVGGNVKLIQNLWPQGRLERRGDLVYAWPNKRQSRTAPLRLRLIRVEDGEQGVYLLTNVLNRRRLSHSAAGRIYRLRWGSELFYRTFKRTLDYAKLRSRNGRRAWLELEWGLISLWVTAMVGIDSVYGKKKLQASRISPAGLLRALRESLLHGGVAKSVRQQWRSLNESLGQAVGDHYRRRGSKASRHRRITGNTPKPRRLKPPNVRQATTQEQRLAMQNHPQLAA